MIHIAPDIILRESEIEECFIRAPGPGGQKVNKTESAVQLRFDARRCAAISNTVFIRLQRLAGRRMTGDGVVVITASRFRTQEQNRRDAMERLTALIAEAARRPKLRRATKPTRASRRRRLEAKKRHGNVKKVRGRITNTDE